jgi:hypothetical protein
MPKFIVTQKVHLSEKDTTEIIEADGFVPQDGWVVFFDENKTPKIIINRETIARVEVSNIL